MDIPSPEELPDILRQTADDIDLPKLVGQSQISLEYVAMLMRLAAEEL